MSKEELLELTGEVIEKLPNAMFRVKLENGVEISDDEVVDTAVRVLDDKLYKSIEDKKELTVINKTHTYEILDSGNIYVKVRFECSEDIARYKPIEHPEYINEQEEQ